MRLEGPLLRVELVQNRWGKAFGDHHDLKDQRGIYAGNSDLSLSVGLGAPPAIRIAGGSGKARPLARLRQADEDGGIRKGKAFRGLDRARQVRS